MPLDARAFRTRSEVLSLDLPVEVDRDSPQSEGLLAWLPFHEGAGEPRDAVRQNNPAPQGTPSWGRDFLDLTNTNGEELDFSSAGKNASPFDGLDEFWMSFWFNVPSGAAGNGQVVRRFFVQDRTASITMLELAVNTNGAIHGVQDEELGYFLGSGLWNGWNDGSGGYNTLFTRDKWHWAAIVVTLGGVSPVFAPAATITTFFDGRLTGALSGGTGPANDVAKIGDSVQFPGNEAAVRLRDVRFHRGIPTERQVTAGYFGETDLYKIPRFSQGKVPEGSGGNTFLFVTGDINFTGQILVANARTTETPATGLVDVTGQPLSANSGGGFTTTPALVDVSGQPLTGNSRASHSAAPGAVDTTGQAVVSNAKTTETPTTGPVDVTGQTLAGNARTITTITSGAMNVVGQAVAFGSSGLAQLTTGAIRFVGQALATSGGYRLWRTLTKTLTRPMARDPGEHKI